MKQKMRFNKFEQMLNNLKVKSKMKYLLILLWFLVLFYPASASPGAGLIYDSESVLVESNQDFCATYSLYNPFEIDSQISLNAEGEIADFVTHSDSEFVPANTDRLSAIEAEICFKAPELRDRRCKIPFLLCAYKCEKPDIIFEGQVLASPYLPTALEGTGSVVGMSIAAPFKIRVSCVDTEYNYWPLILITTAIATFVLIYIILKAIRKSNEADKKDRRDGHWKNYRGPPQPPQQPQQIQYAQRQIPQQPQQYAQPQQQPQQPQQPQQNTQQYPQYYKKK